MKEKGRLWLGVVLGLLAVLLVAWSAPPRIYQPTGVILPAKKIRPPISPDQVIKLQNRPLHATRLGYIHIERRYSPKNQQVQQQIWRLAQQLAASVGANGVVVDFFQVGSVTAGHYLYIFHANAVYVQQTGSLKT